MNKTRFLPQVGTSSSASCEWYIPNHTLHVVAGRGQRVAAPRITVTADFAGGRTLGSLSLLSVGYSLHQFWIYAVMFGTEAILGIAPVLSLGIRGASISLMTIVSLFAFALTLLFFALTDQRFLKAYVSRRFLALGAAAMTAGAAACLVAGMLAGPAQTVVETVAGIVCGWGLATVVIYWGTAFSRLDAMSIALNILLGMLVAIVLYAVLVNFAPVVVSRVLVICIPVLDFAVLRAKTPEPFFKRREWPLFDAMPERKWKFCLMLGLFSTCVGLALGVLRQTSVQVVIVGTDAVNVLGCALAVIVAAAVVIAATALTAGGASWDRLLRFMIPLLGFGVLFLASTAAAQFTLSSFFLLVSYIGTETLVWIFLGEISHRYRLSPVLVFSCGRGSLAVGSLAGFLLPLCADALESFMPFGEGTLIVYTLFIVVIATAMLPDEREIARCVHQNPPEETIFQSESATSQIAGRDTGAYDTSSMDVSFLGDGDALLDGDGPLSGDGPLDGGDGRGDGHGDARGDGGAGMLGGSGGEPLRRGSKGWFRANCALVAKNYQLSERETEVLLLLAKGNNSGAIQEKLYISEGTAKTHIRHIYRKLDVHSQQELIRLVETADEE